MDPELRLRERLRSVCLTSHIRESMVQIMVTPDPRQQSLLEADHSKDWQLRGMTATKACRVPLEGGDTPMNPSACIFWCAVALGALIRGSPIHAVSRLFVERADKYVDEEKLENLVVISRAISLLDLHVLLRHADDRLFLIPFYFSPFLLMHRPWTALFCKH